MDIKCWGARGSAPVSGREFTRYGGHTSCLGVSAGNPAQAVMLDFGSGALPLGHTLLEYNIFEIDVFVTHSHWDHIMGFPLFPLIFQPEASINFYYNPRYQGHPEKLICQSLMKPPHFPVRYEDLPCSINFIQTDTTFNFGPFKASTIPLSHPNAGLGCRLEYQGKSLVFLTDNELGLKNKPGRTYEEYVHFCHQADLLIHDAEYHTIKEYQAARGFGHSLASDVIRLAHDAQVQSLAFFHHNRNRTDRQLDDSLRRLQKEFSHLIRFHFFAFAEGQTVSLN
ncbi:MBL fold metallo-hydrolase [Desulfonatronovibrio magnus]|uniref:MBL fold metallo-hydrolase n=1 Tax=Desulfonatronovibrio magnus TaxID=698827 RepID=UPI0005EB3486|nr:MBL fold metallo-hydrolase [Desulfonatronovibrio magnus]